MQFFHLKQLVIGTSVLASLWAVSDGVSDKPIIRVAFAQGISKPAPKVENGVNARAARRAARTAADDASFSARTATRREPKAALKGITLTKAEKNATGWIAEKFLDRAELLDRDDRNAYRAAGEESTLMADIAALRLEQRAALRATLTPMNRVQFDTNIALLIARGA